MALRRLVSFVSHGAIKNGRLVLNNERYFRTIISGYEDTPQVRVIVERARNSKTQKQLGYLFGVVYPELARHTGHSIEEIDAVLKAKFLKRTFRWRGGDMMIVPSKAELTSDEMGEFITSVIGEAAELGVEVPFPDREWAVHAQMRDEENEANEKV